MASGAMISGFMSGFENSRRMAEQKKQRQERERKARETDGIKQQKEARKVLDELYKSYRAVSDNIKNTQDTIDEGGIDPAEEEAGIGANYAVLDSLRENALSIAPAVGVSEDIIQSRFDAVSITPSKHQQDKRAAGLEVSTAGKKAGAAAKAKQEVEGIPTQVFTFPDGGDPVAILRNDEKSKAALLKKGAIPVNSVNVNATKPSDLHKNPNIQKFRDQELLTRSFIRKIDRALEQSKDIPLTAAGGVIKGIVTTKNTIKELFGQFGHKDTHSENIADYKDVFDKMDITAANMGAFKSNMLSLAYLQAKINDEKGRISDADVKLALEIVGGKVKSGLSLKSIAGDLKIDMVSKLKDMHIGLSRYGEAGRVTPPEDLFKILEKPKPTTGRKISSFSELVGMNHEELVELSKTMTDEEIEALQ